MQMWSSHRISSGKISSGSDAVSQLLCTNANQRPSQGKYAFAIDTYFTHTEGRQRVENFIQAGYLKAFGADIRVTMPALLAIKNGNFKAALGIRSASSALFVEQYLDMPVEQAVMNAFMPIAGQHIERSKIVEIGHLYSNTPKFALPLLLTAGVALFSNDYEYITFCATRHVQDLIRRTGIDLHFMAQANAAKLSTSCDDWGTYYTTSPQVVSISVSDIIRVITQTPKYLEMFSTLAPRIASVSINLAEQLK